MKATINTLRKENLILRQKLTEKEKKPISPCVSELWAKYCIEGYTSSSTKTTCIKCNKTIRHGGIVQRTGIAKHIVKQCKEADNSEKDLIFEMYGNKLGNY